MAVTVIVVDDEPIVRKNISLILKGAGYDVIAESADGLEAIEACRKFRPNAVIMDMNMPILDGASSAEIIIKEKLCNCILALTAFSDRESITNAKLAGMVYFLTKPIRTNSMVSALEIALETSRRMEEMRRTIDDLTQRQQDATYIERAKGIVAAEKDISEMEAYAEMRKISMERRIRIADLARYIVDSRSDKRIILAAKQHLMATRKVSEKEAYRLIKEYSEKGKYTIPEAAQRIVSGGSNG